MTGASLEDGFLDSVRHEAQRYKTLADKALAQVTDEQFFFQSGTETNSIAIVVKHLGGNLRSRWRDFLITDGEKPDRHRDLEFEIAPGTPRAELQALWEEGWGHLTGTLESLTPADLAKTVTIRHEPHGVIDAIHRSLAHLAYHVGQIVTLGKELRGDSWQNLSVPRGGSTAFNQAMTEKFQS